MKISVVVTNWNGLGLLKKNLEQIILTSPEAHEVILADDASTDQSLIFANNLKKKYPHLKIISHPENIGFGKNSNHAVFQAKSDYVVLLNNDIIPHLGYISNSLHHFKNSNLVGVGFSEKNHENWARIFWKSGYLQHEPGLDISAAHITAWVSGGSSIINKELFVKLGGFDEVYAPFYSEDLDLGYRSWKSGYTMLWEPASVVEHHHETTMSRFSKSLLNYIKERNRLLTVLRNITDPKLLRSNKFATIGRILTGPNYIKIVRAAKIQIEKFPPAIVFPKLTDEEVFSKFTIK